MANKGTNSNDWRSHSNQLQILCPHCLRSPAGSAWLARYSTLKKEEPYCKSRLTILSWSLHPKTICSSEKRLTQCARVKKKPRLALIAWTPGQKKKMISIKTYWSLPTISGKKLVTLAGRKSLSLTATAPPTSTRTRKGKKGKRIRGRTLTSRWKQWENAVIRPWSLPLRSSKWRSRSIVKRLNDINPINSLNKLNIWIKTTMMRNFSSKPAKPRLLKARKRVIGRRRMPRVSTEAMLPNFLKLRML